MAPVNFKGSMSVKPEYTRTSDIFIQSIFNTVHNFNGKVKKVAELIDIDPTVLSNKCNPSSDHKLSIHELHKIISVTKDYQSLIALSLEFNHACVQNNLHLNVNDTDIMKSRSNWECERAATCQIIDAALHDNKISSKEINSIKKTMYNDFHKELSLLVKLRGYIQSPTNKDFYQGTAPTFNTILKTVNKSIDNHPGGIEEIADKINTKTGILKNKCDPDNDKHLNVYEFRNIILITNPNKILHTFCESHNHTCLKIKHFKHADNSELLNIRAKWDAERGETDQTIEKALNNQIISENEYRKIKKEMCEDFQREMELFSRLESMQY